MAARPFYLFQKVADVAEDSFSANVTESQDEVDPEEIILKTEISTGNKLADIEDYIKTFFKTYKKTHLKSAFQLIDRDQDGFIDLNDWIDLKSENLGHDVCPATDYTFNQVIHEDKKTYLEEFVERIKDMQDEESKITEQTSQSSDSDSADSELEQEELQFLDEIQKNRFLQSMEHFFDQGTQNDLRTAFRILDIDNSGDVSAQEYKSVVSIIAGYRISQEEFEDDPLAKLVYVIPERSSANFEQFAEAANQQRDYQTQIVQESDEENEQNTSVYYSKGRYRSRKSIEESWPTEQIEDMTINSLVNHYTQSYETKQCTICEIQNIARSKFGLTPRRVKTQKKYDFALSVIKTVDLQSCNESCVSADSNASSPILSGLTIGSTPTLEKFLKQDLKFGSGHQSASITEDGTIVLKKAKGQVCVIHDDKLVYNDFPCGHDVIIELVQSFENLVCIAINEVEQESGSLHLFHSKAGDLTQAVSEFSSNDVFDPITILQTSSPPHMIQCSKNYLALAYMQKQENKKYIDQTWKLRRSSEITQRECQGFPTFVDQIAKDKYKDVTIIEVYSRRDWESITRIKIKGNVSSISISHLDQLFVGLTTGIVFSWQLCWGSQSLYQ